MPRLFGAKLRQLRLGSALTQLQLAEHLHLTSQSHVSHLEAGRKAPLIDLVIRVAELFGVSTDYLLRDITPIQEEHAPEHLNAVLSTYPSLFGIKLRHLRTTHDLQQAELARRLEIQTQAFISFLELGRKQPSPDLVVRIADEFGVTTDYLLLDSIPPEPIRWKHE